MTSAAVSVPTAASASPPAVNSASANHSLIGNGLQLLAVGLGPYVSARLRDAAGVGRYVPDDLDVAGDIEGDVAVMLKVMAVGWNEAFRDHLGPIERSLVSEIRETRNRWAHLEPFNDDDLDRALDSIGRLLAAVGAIGEAERVNQAKHRLRRKRYAPPTPTPARPAARPAAPAESPGVAANSAPDPTPTPAPVAIPPTPGVDAGEKTDALMQRGIGYRQEGDFGKAIADFEEAIGINRESAEAWYQRALTWGHMGEYQRAINDFNRAIALNRDYADAYNDRGYAQFCLGDYGPAIKDFEAAIRLNPDDGMARINLERARRMAKDMREAESRRR